MRRIFVYGTLMTGYGNWSRLLKGVGTLIGTAKTLPTYTMLHLGGFPGVVAVGDTAISGEVFEIPDSAVPSLDRLEGHPGFYRRTPVQVILDDGGVTVDVETYILNQEWNRDLNRSKIVASGDWRQERKPMGEYANV